MANPSIAPPSTTPSHTRWISPRGRSTACAPWPRVTADHLVVVREPLRWTLSGARRASSSDVASAVRGGVLGPRDFDWVPPAWLLPHQVDAARRVAGSLQVFGGALLGDAVGLGKTYVALAVATRYRRVATVVPPSLREQWTRAAAVCGVPVSLVTHESLSRGARLPAADLVVVDEAHRFRNPTTRRYDRLGRDLGAADLLLLTATPVVNRPGDLLALLALFLADDALALFGVRSLAAARERREQVAVAWAAAALTVARSPAVLTPEYRFPTARDLDVVRPAPVPAAELESLVRALDELEIPTFPDATAAGLLRLHLFHRLASSAPALEQTLRRHLAYLDRALAWVARGAPLPRGEAHCLFGLGDDLQFELSLVTAPLSPIGDGNLASRLRQERDRLESLLTRVHRLAAAPSPKADALRRLLAQRGNRKTLVFTTARATALATARTLGWQGVAVVAGGDARIASGSLPLDVALGLFAPVARRVRADTRPSVRVNTLVATDFASEGLDLQDADAVVHYDLPWTPLTLAQRLGRVVRIGAHHDVASVAWFAPPPALDDRIAVTRRVAAKALSQLQLAVPLTSTVGRARVANACISATERLALGAARVSGTRSSPVFAVVAAEDVVIAAVLWTLPGGEVPHIIAIEPPAETPIHDPRRIEALLQRLARGPVRDAPPPAATVDALLRVIRRRLRHASLGPMDAPSTNLRRRVLQHGKDASKARRVRLVDTLDRVMSCLAAGLRSGQVRELAELLEPPLDTRAIERWTRRQRCGRLLAAPGIRIAAALFGDGSATSRLAAGVK